jgi:hypothetical protein
MRVNIAAMPDQAYSDRIARGVAIVSTGTPALSATYPLDLETIVEITWIEASLAGGQGFPGGSATVSFHDLSGATHDMTSAQFTAWARAIRDYFAALKRTARLLRAGQAATWPTQPVTIA